METDDGWMRNWAPLAADYGEYDPLRAGSIDGTDTTPHDHAIIRAVNAKYKPPGVKGDPNHTLFVGRISHSTTEETLSEIFSECGKIRSLRLVRDIVTGRSKGYAFVEFTHTKEAEVAYHRCHKMAVDGVQIIVEFECERSLPGWAPRRLGGGFAGKKESGQLRFGGRERPFKKPILLGSKLLGSRDRRGKEDERRERGDRRRGREGEREGWGEERRRGREGWGEERREDKRWESGEERWGKRPRRDSLEHRYDHTDFRGRH